MMKQARKIPTEIDLTNPAHRVVVLRAKLALLSHGGVEGDHHPKCMTSESAATAVAPGYALRHWQDLT